MSLFKPQRPRPFHHERVYGGERRDRLRQIEQQARRELGLDDSGTTGQPTLKSPADRLNGVFLSATKHASRHSRQRHTLSRFNIVLLLFLLAIALVVLKVLMIG